MRPIIKHVADAIVDHSPTCGEGREILTSKDYPPFSVAIFADIRPTHPHYHETFDETYLVLEGDIEIQLFDPSDGQLTVVKLAANELCVIPKLTHHGVAMASDHNRVCVLAAPPFHMDDEHLSDRLPDFALPNNNQ